MLTGKTVVVGVTGGIAAYKAADLVSRLRKWHADVRVIMTESATHLISPLTFRELSGSPVIVDMFAEVAHWQVQHISLARAADLLVVAPATANIIGKIACGIADDMLSTTVMATTAPVLLAPAMNANMYRNRAVQENLKRLSERGFKIIGPESGHLLCGDDDIGRMSPPEAIAERILAMVQATDDLKGVNMLITAGGTREPIDPVRFIGNRSSGRMGYALAGAAVERGANVTLISAPGAKGLAVPGGAEVVYVETTCDMFEAVLKRFDHADVVIKAAAPADYRPSQTHSQKIKKRDQEELEIQLVSNPDILGELGRRKTHQVLIGFAAETENLMENAGEKLAKKNLDLIVANDVSNRETGFESENNRVTLLSPEGSRSLELMPKIRVAHEILDEVSSLLARKTGRNRQ